MYKSTDYEQQQLSFFHFNGTCGMALDKSNEWIKNGNRLPWKACEVPYAAMFTGVRGPAAKPCSPCGYVYDPEVGDPDSGIAPGTAFEDIPEDWVCPVCGLTKDMFEEE